MLGCPTLPETIAAKLEARTNEPDSQGCRLWTGTTNDKGYPRLTIVGYKGQRRHAGAHRLTLERKIGRPLAEGMQAMHACDNPRCVAAAHLSEGTPADNAKDRNNKARQARGQKHGNHTLTEADVLRILGQHFAGADIYHLTTEYPQVNPRHMRKICQGERWQHLYNRVAREHMDKQNRFTLAQPISQRN
jgi:hypothetical protein